jgi:hypothetical protein
MTTKTDSGVILWLQFRLTDSTRHTATIHILLIKPPLKTFL